MTRDDRRERGDTRDERREELQMGTNPDIVYLIWSGMGEYEDQKTRERRRARERKQGRR